MKVTKRGIGKWVYIGEEDCVGVGRLRWGMYQMCCGVVVTVPPLIRGFEFEFHLKFC